MTQQERFEAWAKSQSLNTDHKEKDAWGEATYAPHIESMWFGWKAAQSQAFGVSVEPVANLHVTQTDSYLSCDIEVLDGEKLQTCDSPVRVYTAEALAAARAQALEEAVKVCEGASSYLEHQQHLLASRDCANAIRALS